MLATANAAAIRYVKNCLFMVNFLSAVSLFPHVVLGPSSNCYRVLESEYASTVGARSRTRSTKVSTGEQRGHSRRRPDADVFKCGTGRLERKNM